MKKTGTATGSDFIPYDRALNVGMSLIKDVQDKKQILGLYIVVSINLGLRISDILTLTWEMIKQDNFLIIEKKTGKKRNLVINDHIKNAVTFFDPKSSGLIFISKKRTIYRIQSINVLLKYIFHKESRTLQISSHSFRKSFGRAIYDKLGQSEKALIFLSEMFNHSSLRITRIYLGIRQEEINNIYLSL